MRKGTQLQEIYALQLQMLEQTKDHAGIRTVYARALQIKSAIPHPRVVGAILGF